MLNKSDYPFLSDQELGDLSADVTRAAQLNEKRHQDFQIRIADEFVTRARDAQNFAESRNATLTEQIMRYKKRSNNNEVVAIDMLLFNNPELRAELNVLRSNAPISYAGMAAKVGETEFNRYMDEEKKYSRIIRAANQSTDVPGQGNTLQTTVSQSILYRVDNFQPVVNLVEKINMPFGDFDASKYNNYGVAGYIAEDANVPDNTSVLTDATNGIDKVKYSGKEFGVSFAQSYLASKRINAAVINQMMNLTEMEIGRGEALQIMSGSGVGLNDNGIVNVATPAPLGGNVLLTASNAIAAVEAANNSTKDLNFVMNAKAWNEHRLLSASSLSYQAIIDVSKQTLWGVPVTIVGEIVMPTVANAADVVVGNFKHYIKFTNGGLDRLDLTNTSTAATTTMYLMSRDGGVIFSDSFANYSVSV